MTINLRWLAACLVWAAALLAGSAAESQPGSRASVPDDVRSAVARDGSTRVIVRVRQAFQAEGRLDRRAALEQRARVRERLARVINRLPRGVASRRFQLTPFFAAEVDAGALAQLEADPDVLGIEPDTRLRPGLAESGPLVGAPTAWARGYTGIGWTIAVLDTGIDATHPFLAGKVVSEACYSNAGGTAGGTSVCPGGVVSSTAVGSARPCAIAACDHGTHVAGIAAGLGSNVSGVARDATLVSMQVFTRFDTAADCGSVSPCIFAYTSDVILALERVFALKDTHRIAVVNMSFGAGLYSSRSSCDIANASLKAAVDQLRSVGIAAISSSGNDGSFNSMSSPACLSSVVSVGSTTKSDQVSSFTNAASFLDLLAPGSAITSSAPGGGVGVKSGTSMAAPHVAGAWALLKQRRPSATVDQALTALKTTGLGVTDPLSGLVFPRIRVADAVNALLPTQLVVEAPGAAQTLALPFSVSGWALDPLASSGTGVDAVHVWAYPGSGAPIFLGAAVYGATRSDVAALFGAHFANPGFSLPVTSLAPGPYQLISYAHNIASGEFDAAHVTNVTVVARPSDPRGFIDAPAAGAIVTPTFTVSGWAIDHAASGGTGVDAVHVYAYPNPGSGAPPIFMGAATYGIPRSDLVPLFGASFANAGYSLTATLGPGVYRIVVFSHSTVTGVFNSQTRDITVRTPGDPLLTIDTPVFGAVVGRTFFVGGWAIDRDAAAGSGIDVVHVWAYPDAGGAPIFLGSATIGGARGDVANAYGSQFIHSGFDLITAAVPPGGYSVVVYGRSVVTGMFSIAQVVRVIVSE